MATNPLNPSALSSAEALARSSGHALELAVGSAETLRRQVEVLDPMHAIRESFSFRSLIDDALLAASAADNFKREFESMRALAQPEAHLAALREAERVKREIESMRAMSDSQTRIRDDLVARSRQFESVIAQGRETARFFDDLASDHNALNKAMREAHRWSESYGVIAKSLKRYDDPTAWSSVRSLVESLAMASNAVSFDVAGDAVAGERLDAGGRREVAAELTEIVASASVQPTMREAVDEIVGAIERTGDTIRQRFLWVLLVPLLLMLLNDVLAPMGDFYVKKKLEASSPQAEVKAVKQAAREAFGSVQVVSDFRFVSSKAPLTVFATPGAKAPTIGQLHFGQAVRVLKRTRDFTLVAWKSQDDEAHLQGWVFSRYLKRFD